MCFFSLCSDTAVAILAVSTTGFSQMWQLNPAAGYCRNLSISHLGS